MTETETKAPPTCSVCGKELEYGGRGRPPTKCDEHKKAAKPPSENGKGKEEKQMPEAEAPPRARPRPGQQKPDAHQEKPAEPQEPLRPKPQATPDTGSRAKATAAHKRTEDQLQVVDSEAWPRGVNNRPMAKITMTASELIPTGQYANVSIGPAQITAFIDLDREVEEEGGYFTSKEQEILVGAMNELAEVIERDVVAVQRNIVLETMQEQLSQS